MRRVLLIDDDVQAAAALAQGLSALGWEVSREADGALGLARALRERPAAVIAELALPGVDGPAIASTVRLAPGRAIPVILTSARDGGDGVARAAGACAFLEKPVDAASAAALLTRCLASEPEVVNSTGSIRVPAADVFGDAPVPVASERGVLRAGWLPEVLLRLYDRRATGVLEVEAEEARFKVFLQRGAPAASRSSAPGTELGRVLTRLGVLTPDAVDQAVNEARRKRRPLGDELVETALLERATAERALREQIVARLVDLHAKAVGNWAFTAAEPIGLAGFEVPLGVVWWRLGEDVAGAAPSPGMFPRFDGPRWAWPLLDPEGELGAIRAVMAAGATAAACLAEAGTVAPRLFRVLRRFGLLAYVDEAPPAAPNPADTLDLSDLEAAVASRHRAWADADHYTLFGLAPDAPAAEVHVASLATLSALNPAHLPPGVSGATQERAQSLFARALEASRILQDPDRREVYDTMLGRRSAWRTEHLSEETNPVLLAERAQHCFRRGEFVTAAALFFAANRVDEDPDMLAMLGRTRRLACPEDPGAGEADLMRAVELGPDAEFPLYWLARLHYERGELEQSRALLRELLDHHPEFELARDALRLFS